MSIPIHFLVVDDHLITRCLISALLTKLSCTIKISEAENGQKALDLLQEDDWIGMPVNFVVTDWNMPAMDGLSLLRVIRASAALQHLPVLLVTADSESTESMPQCRPVPTVTLTSNA